MTDETWESQRKPSWSQEECTKSIQPAPEVKIEPKSLVLFQRNMLTLEFYNMSDNRRDQIQTQFAFSFPISCAAVVKSYTNEQLNKIYNETLNALLNALVLFQLF